MTIDKVLYSKNINEKQNKRKKTMKNINIKNIRYFKTRQGLGYEVKTDKGAIWNDGNCGSTYFEANSLEIAKEFSHLTEWDLESLIDKHEGV
tara:strand:- start:116 stop:391 length:276 start_codon:yes stop_codon:yes gene_type:complete